MITLEAFEPFLASEDEADKVIIAQNKFGVLVLEEGVWVPKEITAEEFVNYEHVTPNAEAEVGSEYHIDGPIFTAAREANIAGNHSWPIVRLVSE